MLLLMQLARQLFRYVQVIICCFCMFTIYLNTKVISGPSDLVKDLFTY